MSTTTPARPASHRLTAGPLAGTRTLAWFLLRRDRLRISAWLLALTAATVATANNFTELYPTTADRQALAATMESPAMIAMAGVNHAPHDYTYGAMMGHQMLWFTALLTGLMSVLLFVRHTRLEEATGRAELIRSTVVGRHAPVAAALLVVGGANLALGVLLAAGLGSLGVASITWSGAMLYGLAHTAVGLVFAGVAAVTVQLSEYSRGATGIALAVLGLAYALRASGDVAGTGVSWLSPLGWIQATEVFVTNRWSPLLLPALATVTLVGSGLALSTRRDVGAALRAPRPGPATASAALARPVGLAFRLHRGNLVGWSVGLLLLGAMYGSVLGDAEQMLAEVDALEGILAHLDGASLTDGFAAMIATVLALIAGVYTVLAALKARGEERKGRAEPVLVTAVTRSRWLLGHTAATLAGSVVVLTAGGLGLGLGGAAATQDPRLLPELVGATIAYTPALWTLAGVTLALFGVLPNMLPAVWTLPVYSFVVVYLGGLLQLPDWMSNLSPFGHIPQLPVDTWDATSTLALTGVAIVAATAGVAGFRRRDLHTPA